MKLEESVLSEINRILRMDLGFEREARPEDDLLRDLQLDSIGVLTLVVGLEDRFRITLDEHDAEQVRSVGELVAMTVRRAGDQERAS